MGEMDKPAPLYVYTSFGLAFSDLALLSTAQWSWALVVSAMLLAQSALVVWFAYLPFRRHQRHQACLERTYYLELACGFTPSVPKPKSAKEDMPRTYKGTQSCSTCDQKRREFQRKMREHQNEIQHFLTTSPGRG